MEEIEIPSSFIKQDIKVQGINKEELDELFNLTNSFEELFSRRAKLYQERNLKEENLLEEDYKRLIIGTLHFFEASRNS